MIKVAKLFLILLMLISNISIANADLNNVNMPFVKNVGQAPKHVAYYVNTPKASVFIDVKGNINYNFKHKDKSVVVRETMTMGKQVLSMRNQQPVQVNIIKGKDKSKWHKSIPNASEIDFGEVWKGIDVKLVTRPGNVEKLFTLKPQANVEQIRLSLSGIEKLEISDNGQLAIQTEINQVAFTKPIAWQNIDGKRIPIEVSYITKNKNYGFKLGQYDHSKELIIDPLLASTYVGGGLDEYVAGVHVNSNNEIIVAGSTGSIDFPTTTGVISEMKSGSSDFFALRFNADLSQLLAATYLGGSGREGNSSVLSTAKLSVAFDANDNIYFAGESTSADFPLPANPYVPYQESEDANGSIFIAALSADFTEVIGATHIGGGIVDVVYDIEIAPNGNIYISGFTNSNDYPFTSGALETSGKGMLVSVFNPDLSLLLFSTRLGGGHGYRISMDTDGSIFLAGIKTGNSIYTTTSGVFREMPLNNLGAQIYLAHLSDDLSTLNAATFIYNGDVNQIEFASNDQLIVSARTSNGGFPVNITAFDETQLPGGSTTIFTIDKTMTAINAATHIDLGFDRILVENDGNILILGLTTTLDFPGGNDPSDPMNSGLHGGLDFVIARINSDLTQVSHSSYIGGTNNEYNIGALLKDNNGNVIIAGVTASNDVFMTNNPYDNSNHGNGDVIILKATSDLNFGPFIDNIFCDSFESPNGNGSCD